MRRGRNNYRNETFFIFHFQEESQIFVNKADIKIRRGSSSWIIYCWPLLFSALLQKVSAANPAVRKKKKKFTLHRVRIV